MINDAYQEQLEITAGSTGFVSPDAEKAVLSVLMHAGDAAQDICSQLKPDDFGDALHAEIYKAILALTATRTTVDYVSTVAEIDAQHALDGMSATLKTALTDAISSNLASVSKLNIDTYVSVVQRLSARRSALAKVQDAALQLRDPAANLDAILNGLSDTARDTTTSSGGGWTDINSLLMATYDDLEKRSKGDVTSITSGITSIDNIIGGFLDGELSIVAARTSVGKSAFALNIAIEAARAGKKVLFVSREMTDTQFGSRLLARFSGVDGSKLRNAKIGNDDWMFLGEALTIASNLPIDFTFRISTVEELRAATRRKVMDGKCDILVVDYLQIMNTARSYKDEHLRLGHISRTLKEIAVDNSIPVVALAQVNRESDGLMPTLKNLKGSGDIEQDADGVLFLHRPQSDKDPTVYAPDAPYVIKWLNQGLTYIVIEIAKQRQGQTGRTAVLFDSAHMRYYDIDRQRGDSNNG